MKYKITASFDLLEPDILELDDSLSEAEVEEEIRQYVVNFLDWCYEKIDDEN